MEESTPNHAYGPLLEALSLIPIWHYLLFFSFLFLTFLYNFLDFHFFEDLFNLIRPSPELLTFHPFSPIYHDVVSKCPTLHSRYFATPWLSNPHFQTTFLNFHGRPPTFSYTRQLFYASDGGTIALDWLMTSDVSGGDLHMNNSISKHDTTPIVVVVPGLTSDSSSAFEGIETRFLTIDDPTTSLRTLVFEQKAKGWLSEDYLKHLAFHMAKSGWNVVISNHRGLGGVSITSDCFYNAGWTEDIRVVLNHLHDIYPEAPLFAVGTSIGANILVKYLGEDGENVPLAGAVAICNPWDLLIGDRFICRRLLQTFYDRALAIGLKGYAKLHEPQYTRLANWEGIKTSRSIRDFDIYATCLVGKFETVDTYYRRCSSASYVGNVSVPLLCISSLDDPLCTREAIPWDECRANKNIVLSTPRHGGHLAMFEGISASRLWWVRATYEFLSVLSCSPHMHVQKKVQKLSPWSSTRPLIDQGPYVNVAEDGMISAACTEQTKRSVSEAVSEEMQCRNYNETGHNQPLTEAKSDLVPDSAQSSERPTSVQDANKPLKGLYAPVRRCLDQLSRHNKYSMWLLALVAITTSWPWLASALHVISRKKQRKR